MDLYLEDGGKLLVAGYTFSKHPEVKVSVDETLTQWGFSVVKTTSGFCNNEEQTRVAVLAK
jgi:hypothetical protein